MKSLVILTLAFVITNAFPQLNKPGEQNAREADVEGRITFGEYAYNGQFPYQVGVELIVGTSSYLCGGSLIGHRWVVTAVHCTNGASSAIIYLGSVSKYDSTVSHWVSSKSIHQHPNFNLSTLANDIALIEIPYTDYSDYVKAIKIPSISANASAYAHEWAVASGWGESDQYHTYPDYLLYAYLQTMTNSECSAYWGISSKSICIATPYGVSVCNGDSGGPLALYSKNLLIGVTSYGHKNCTVGVPAVFVRISSYLDWIKEVSGIFY